MFKQKFLFSLIIALLLSFVLIGLLTLMFIDPCARFKLIFTGLENYLEKLESRWYSGPHPCIGTYTSVYPDIALLFLLGLSILIWIILKKKFQFTIKNLAKKEIINILLFGFIEATIIIIIFWKWFILFSNI